MKTKLITKVTACRVCEGTHLQKILSFGPTPLANAFLQPEQLDREEYFYPLDVYFCQTCSFLQLGHVVDPKILFGDYVYVSSTSKVFIEHFQQFADDITKRFELSKESLVIDIGSNDGILLNPLKKKGIKTLGIEPAKAIAKVANRSGIKTLSEYFSIDLAKRIVSKFGKANVVTATNVFAHIHDLNEVIKGVKVILGENGVFIIEAPYIIDFVTNNYFDLVYHEHLSYWSVKTLQTLFKRFAMRVFDVQKVSVHGGSIRIFVCKDDADLKETKNVQEFINSEKLAKTDSIDTFFDFSKKVLRNKEELLNLLIKLKNDGKRIAGYGAPAKGNTLLNYFSIGNDLIDFIVDDSPNKQGLYTPGKRIPVVSSDTLCKEMPDYLLILAWNFAPSIMKNTEKYTQKGGRYIIPVPKPKVM